jgi:hypothetical protein
MRSRREYERRSGELSEGRSYHAEDSATAGGVSSVIGKVSAPRGKRVEPLVRYLFGPGRREEHTDPHIVAGWRHPAELEPPLLEDGRRDLQRLNGLLQQPHAVLGERGFARPVWHCSIRAAPGDKILSDDEWAQIVCDIMHRTGLAPYGEEDDAVRWIAVRHAEDHVHIVAMLARQDGHRVNLWRDFYQVGDACRAAEERYGLRRTAPRDRTAARRPTRAEAEKARRTGQSEAPRVTLRRLVSTAAAGADGEDNFFARLDRVGVLVRKRFSTQNPGAVTGYAVALPGNTTKGGTPVWYGGGKLAADLTLPKLRSRWHQPASQGHDKFSTADRQEIWDHAARIAGDAAKKMPFLTMADPAVASDIAWAAADTLRAAAEALGSSELRQAADAYDRAARLPYGRIPKPNPFGVQLRQAARVLSAMAWATGNRRLTAVTLILRLAALIEAVAELREAQRQAAQAASARTAAKRLYAAADRHSVPAGESARQAPEATQLVATSFPKPPPLRQSAQSHAQAGSRSSRRAPSPGSRRPRGSGP